MVVRRMPGEGEGDNDQVRFETKSYGAVLTSADYYTVA